MSNQYPKISIIIPAYNAALTLERAVYSVIKQKKENVEVIIVENGSTDNTRAIAQQLAKSNENIIVITSQKGVSTARNMGLKVASGEFITFLDADDILNDQAIDNIQNQLLNDCDLSIFKIKMGNRQLIESQQRSVYSGNDLKKGISKIICQPTQFMQVVGNIYKKSIIDINDIYFDDTMHISEDSDFTFRYLAYVKSLEIIDTVIYCCFGDNKQSITRQHNPNKLNQMIDALTKTYEKSKLFIETNQLHAAYRQYVLMNLNVLMVREIFSKQVVEPFHVRLKKMAHLVNQQPFANAIKETRLTKNAFQFSMLPIIFLKYHMGILAAIIYRIRAIQNDKIELPNIKEVNK